MSMTSILSVAEAYHQMASEDSKTLAATDAAQAQKDQEPTGKLPDWVPGDLPDNEKKEFVEAVKKAYEAQTSQFDFNGRTYKITEKLHGNQDKLDVDNDGKIEADDLAALRNDKKPETTKEGLEDACWKNYEAIGTKQKNGRTVPNCVPKEELTGNQNKLDVNKNGKIDGDDLATLRSGKKVEEDHMENETETPGQTEYPGSDMPAPEDDEEESAIKEGEEEKYYSNEDNPMSRERHTYNAPATKSYSSKSYSSKSIRGGHTPTSAMTSIANQASATASTKSDHTRAATLHTRAATGHGTDSPQRKVHQDAAKKHSDTAAGLKEAANDATDTLTIDVPAMIRALEKSREDFKSDEDIHNFVQDLLKKKDSTIDTDTLPKNESVNEAKDYHAAAMSASAHAKKQPSAATHKAASASHEKAITWHERKINALIKKDGSADEVKKHEDHIKMHKNEAQKHRFNAHRLGKSQKNESVTVAEKLDPNADAGVWISDFVNSKDPRFDGKSKEERKQQALAAYYAARREAGIKESTDMNNKTLTENVAGDPRAAELTTAANQASALVHASAHSDEYKLKQHDAATRAHQQAADHYRIYAHHAGDPVLRNVAGIHQKFHSDMAQHHTLRGVNFSMDESTVSEGAPADAKGGPEVMDPKTKKMKDDADNNVKAEEAPYTNKADGSENIVPADKPAAKPSAMTKLTNEQALRTVADAYTEMLKINKK